MIRIPSYKAAILFGAIGMPAFVFILNFLDNRSENSFPLLVWFLIGFGIPFLYSTGEFSYIKQEMRKGRSFFGPWTKSQDFKSFFFPTWKRMFVWFLSAAISLTLLNLIGIDLS